MPEFVFNRTKRHLDRLRLLRSKGYENLSESERAEYRNYAALGAYNHTDINRVEAAVAEIAPLYGLNLTTNAERTNWTVPVKSSVSGADDVNMVTYLSNVVSIRDAALAKDDTLTFPVLPDSMDNLTWELANNIEETLYVAYEFAKTFAITATHDGEGNVTVSGGVTVTHDGDGNVVLIGATATSDGNGNVTIE